jgi:hypothetical protein
MWVLHYMKESPFNQIDTFQEKLAKIFTHPIFAWKMKMGWGATNGNFRIIIQSIHEIRLNSKP